jgi:dihydroorotate dehydrogenase
LKRTVFGLTFSNPVGLAAGLDKNALAYNELGNFGFSFVEIGTVTPKPQYGNPKPRLFRLKSNQALLNRMGFNNDGVDKIARRIKRHKPNVILGGNIGKNKITENENAYQDYEYCFKALFPFVDYFVVNVSSPNTPGLRELQEKEPLKKILNQLMHLNHDLALAHSSKPKPILLKIAPDLTDTQLDDIIEIVKDTKTDGIVATNTTTDRSGLDYEPQYIQSLGAGGISGTPLKNKSTEVIKYLHVHSNGTIPIIGVGGINSPEDALEKLEAGASLIQLYTGFVYQGPCLVKAINQALIDRK